MLTHILKSVGRKILASATSKRAIALSIAFVVSAFYAAAKDAGVDVDVPANISSQSEQLVGTIGMLATLFLAVWTDTQRPLDPRDSDGRTKQSQDW